MAYNKVIYNGATLIDLTNDTVAPENLLAGAVAIDASGRLIDGEKAGDMESGIIDITDTSSTYALTINFENHSTMPKYFAFICGDTQTVQANSSYTIPKSPRINGVVIYGKKIYTLTLVSSYSSSTAMTWYTPTLNDSAYTSVSKGDGSITITPIKTVWDSSDTYRWFAFWDSNALPVTKSIKLSTGGWSAYDGNTVNGHQVYRSVSNYNVNNGVATATITLSGYADETFSVMIRSYAESTYDYTIAYALDSTSTELINTSGKQSATQYYEASYTIPDDEEHTITISYKKDGSVNKNDDRGYFYINMPETEVVE